MIEKLMALSVTYHPVAVWLFFVAAWVIGYANGQLSGYRKGYRCAKHPRELGQ